MHGDITDFPQRFNRPGLLIGLLVVLLPLGFFLWMSSQQSAGSPSVGATTPAQPAAPAPLAVGGVVVLRTNPLLFVQEGAFLLYERAKQERDDKTALSISRTYEWIDLSSGTSVRIIQLIDQRAQVDVIDGPGQTRRGWLERAQLVY